MTGPGLHIKKFYRRHIHPYDPSLLVARRSRKAMAALTLATA